MVPGFEEVQEPWNRTWGENVTKPSLTATNSGKEEMSSNPGNPMREAGQIESLAPGSVWQQC